MATVLQFTRKLESQPTTQMPPNVTLRHFAGPADIRTWLELRRRAFARQRLGVRDWDEADFAREFLEKPWWTAEAMWFAEVHVQLPSAEPPQVVGTITLAQRSGLAEDRPVVHWLAVLPSYRSLGIGSLLIATLEAAVWAQGGRQVWLETHGQWTEALRLYQKLGYEPVGQ